jgi:hypothetical protein
MRAAGLDRAEKRLNKEGVAEGKNTNPRVNEIRQLAKDFFGYKPYSSGTIQGGKILRLSFPFNRSLSTFYHSVPLTQVSPQDQQLLKKLKSDFEQFMASNGVSADEVSMKFHTGAGVYASVRIAIPQEQGMAETRRGQIPMTLQPGETDNIEPENISGFRTLPAYKQGQAAQQKAGKQLIQKSPHTYQSDQDWAYRQGAFDAQQAAMFANFGKSKPLTIEGGEQQKGADYRDPKEVDYDDEYDAMVARVKKLAGVGPMRTVYDPNKRVYRNMPTAQQPKK